MDKLAANRRFQFGKVDINSMTSFAKLSMIKSNINNKICTKYYTYFGKLIIYNVIMANDATITTVISAKIIIASLVLVYTNIILA